MKNARPRAPRWFTGIVPSLADYDRIGAGYAAARRTDHRLAERIWGALGDARSVLNVGAGTASYEPSDRAVAAVEPSSVMIAQRPPDAAPVVRAAAECCRSTTTASTP